MGWLDNKARKIFDTKTQYIFYRCFSCKRIIIDSIDVLKGSCKCGSRRYQPTNLSSIEELVVIFKMIRTWLGI
jgi:hypothetical protein